MDEGAINSEITEIMKKIMFNDKHGLTKAVLEGRKTMTRRIIPPIVIDWNRRGKVTLPVSCFKGGTLFMDASATLGRDSEYPVPAKYQPRFNAGEIVAVAQAYKDTCWTSPVLGLKDKPGWSNKMFVYAGLMPHKIRIKDVRVQRLQNISDEDCLREGIIEDCPGVQYSFPTEIGYCGQYPFDTPRDAFAALIDKVSGKGTWDSNPWVFVYEFELVK